MAREIIRILEKELKEVEEKCRWALVFSNREEAEKARKRLSWRSIWPNDQRAERLLWINKEEAERARNHVGGLIEPWEPSYRGKKPVSVHLGPPRVEAPVKRIEEWVRVIDDARDDLLSALTQLKVRKDFEVAKKYISQAKEKLETV